MSTTSFNSTMADLSQPEPFTLLKLEVLTGQSTTTWRFCLQDSISWNNQAWSLTPFNLSGEGDKAGGEQSRPTLILPNPEGMFSSYIARGYLLRARVTKYEVHPSDINTDRGIVSQWYVSKLLEINNKAISLELSALSDGNSFKLPSRRFTQPEFGLVRI